MSNFDIQILLRLLKWGRISTFDIRNPYFDIQTEAEYRIWHSKSYFDIQTEALYQILNSKFNFDIQTEAEYQILTLEILFLTFELRSNIVF